MKLLSYCRLSLLAAAFFLPSSPMTGQAAVTESVSVQIVGPGTVTLYYGKKKQASFSSSQAFTIPNNTLCTLSAKAKKGFAFANWTYTDAHGPQTNPAAKFTFTNSYVNDANPVYTATFVDAQRPALKVNAIPNKKALTSDTLIIGGAARDNVAVTNVFFRMDTSNSLDEVDWESASTFNHWSNWWFTASLAPGETNFLHICAVDSSGLFSKTNKLQLIQAFAPASLANTIMTVDGLGVLDFGTDTFTKIFADGGGVGNFHYKKSSSVNGRLTLNFTAPPSTKGFANKADITLQFVSETNGIFKNSSGDEYDFTLEPANDWATPAMTGASLIFSSDDGIHQSLLIFPEPPTITVGTNWIIRNPLEIPLNSDYPGQLGDRVKVPFQWNQYLFINGAWTVVTTTPSIAGTVIDIGDSTVTVFFDNLPQPDAHNVFAPLGDAPLDILSFSYTDSVDNTLGATGSGLFTYAQTSPDGGLLQLDRNEQHQIITLYFTEDAKAGSFYEEDYDTNSSLIAVNSGTFAIAAPPQITTHPASQVVSNGHNASFTVKASGTPVLVYQWQFNTNNLMDGTNSWGSIITGSTTTNLVISGVSSNDLGSYRVVVTNLFGSANSSTATLSFPLPQEPPQITNQPPGSVFTTNGFNAAISVGATGSAPLAYQWRYLGASPANPGTNMANTVNITGVTSNILSFVPAFTNNAGYYQVIITNLYGSVTSAAPTFLNVVTNQFIP
jgi:hypothetical protein